MALQVPIELSSADQEKLNALLNKGAGSNPLTLSGRGPGGKTISVQVTVS